MPRGHGVVTLVQSRGHSEWSERLLLTAAQGGTFPGPVTGLLMGVGNGLAESLGGVKPFAMPAVNSLLRKGLNP